MYDDLSIEVESGAIGVAIGYLPHRRHQVPKTWPSPVLRFLDKGSPSRGHPRPQDALGHPVPRPPTPRHGCGAAF